MIREDFQLEAAAWDVPAERAALEAVRRLVFIDEQDVPEAEEWDEYDARSKHLLVKDRDGKPIGTGRLTPNGRIGRMAVVADWRGKGVGETLLRALMDLAKEAGFSDVYLAAQTHAIPFYERAGFSAHGEIFDDAGIPHQMMSMTFDDSWVANAQAQRPPASDQQDIESRVELVAAYIELVENTRRELLIYSRDLDPPLTDRTAFLEAFKQLALRVPGRNIRILLADERAPIRHGHRLVELIRRLPSRVEVRVPGIDDADYPSAFLVGDARTVIFRDAGHRFEAQYWLHDRGHAQRAARQFERMWARSEPTKELRTLS